MARLNRPVAYEPTTATLDRLYIFSIRFESGMEVVKIGKSSGKSSLDRMLQIQRDYFNKYRCTFICRIVRDRECEEAFKYETALHSFFKEYRYTPKTAFSGSTELFCISLDAAKEAYEYILDNGIDSLKDFEYDPSGYKETEPDNLLF